MRIKSRAALWGTGDRRWRDRVFADELFKAEANGAADSTKGGYYYPLKKAKAASAPFLTYAAGESAKFDVKTDLLEVVKDMRKRNVPGTWACTA
ncbi:hypothetical protein EBT31_19670 [bacterium]|nr:hypothetical protein [bacterium]